MSEREAPAGKLPPGVAHEQGLTSAQVASARQTHGFNDIVAEPAKGWLAVARDTVRDPMLWFLLVTATLFALLGQLRESWVLLLALAPLLGMDAWLHHRTLASAAGLAARLASTASALRDGHRIDVPSRELVPGDLVEVMPGRYFPADGLLVAGQDLQADESTLTGESLPVRKTALQAPWSAGQRLSEVHWGTAGTRLLTGTARLRVVAEFPFEARAMAILLLCSAAYAAALTGLRQPVVRWIVAGALAPLVLLVQVPALSASLGLSPMHLADWGLAAAGAVMAYVGTRWLARGLSKDTSAPAASSSSELP